MKLVIQRSLKATVTVNDAVVGAIDKGFVILVGVEPEDTQKDVDYLVKKVSQLRIFEDEQGKMNLSILEVKGQVLSVSQFTLFADTKKGNRPSFIKAASPDLANKLYEAFNIGLREWGIKVETGVFGAHMEVALINDGPVTIIIDSKENMGKNSQ